MSTTITHQVKVTGPFERGGSNNVYCQVFILDESQKPPKLVPAAPLSYRWHMQKRTAKDPERWGYDETQLVGYDKGTNLNEFTISPADPRYPKDTLYRIRLETVAAQDALSEWSLVDWSLSWVPDPDRTPSGQVPTEGWNHPAYEAIATPLTYGVVNFLKKREGLDVFDDDTRFNPLRFGG